MEKHDKQLTARLYATEQQNTQTVSHSKHSERLMNLTPSVRRKAVIRLWQRMTGIYGTHWVRTFGDAKGEQLLIWEEALGRLTLEQIKRGVEFCVEDAGDFPPNLGQFTKACLSSNKNPPEVQKYLEAPEKEHNPEFMRKIRREQKKVSASKVSNADFRRAYEHLGLNTRWGPLPKTHSAMEDA